MRHPFLITIAAHAPDDVILSVLSFVREMAGQPEEMRIPIVFDVQAKTARAGAPQKPEDPPIPPGLSGIGLTHGQARIDGNLTEESVTPARTAPPRTTSKTERSKTERTGRPAPRQTPGPSFPR